MSEQARVLITSVGSWVGFSLINCLRQSPLAIEIIGLNANRHDPPVSYCDRLIETPKTADPSFELAFVRAVEETSPDLILPSRDGDLKLLSTLKTWAEERGTVVAAPSPHIAKVFDDKGHTSEFATRHGLPFARSALTRADVEVMQAELGYPLIAKRASGGEASKDVYVINNDEQRDRALAAGIFVFQEFLAPEESNYLELANAMIGTPWISAIRDRKTVAEIVIGRSGEIVSATTHAMRHVDTTIHGISEIEVPTVTETALAYGKALSEHGYRGAVNIQGKHQPGRRFVVFELNGRFSRACWARARLGRNQVLEYAADALGRPELVPPVPERKGREATEYPFPEVLWD
jgi:carbamoylphosphate synthase large subunit